MLSCPVAKRSQTVPKNTSRTLRGKKERKRKGEVKERESSSTTTERERQAGVVVMKGREQKKSPNGVVELMKGTRRGGFVFTSEYLFFSKEGEGVQQIIKKKKKEEINRTCTRTTTNKKRKKEAFSLSFFPYSSNS
jgi:hypothetical protein